MYWEDELSTYIWESYIYDLKYCKISNIEDVVSAALPKLIIRMIFALCTEI